MNLEGKTKDTKRDRLDLADLDIRRELPLQLHGNHILKPPACYTLSSQDRTSLCQFLKHVRLPNAFTVDISINVSVANGKISGLEAYDCHEILQRLLPRAAHPYLRKDIVTTLTELSTFFQNI